MRNTNKNGLKSNKKGILLIVLISLNVFLFPMNYFESFSTESQLSKDLEQIESEEINYLETNVFGFAPWWDQSFEHRRLINVSNSYGFDFTDYGVSVSFNYANLVLDGKMQSDLDDIRIVEKGILRKYYIKKDYPSPNLVTVWFDTNISKNSMESDTYLYFGNPTAANNEASDPSDSFGWIKNGDFEIDIDSSSKFEPFGWTFSHNPVDEIQGIAHSNQDAFNSSETSYEFFVNKLISNPLGAERVAQGTYAYKFGALSPTLPDGAVNDYAGTFFSYPFTIPIVDGGISLSFFRNIRTYRFERPKSMGEINYDGYFIRILNGSSNYVANPDDHDDNAISPTFQNYIESYDGYAYYNPPAKKWNDPTKLIDFPDHLKINDTFSDTGETGQLTGYVDFDLTPYMGQKIYFELGVWGTETNEDKKEKSAFFQVDDLRFNYSLSTSINDIQDRTSDVTITTRDIDGRLVTNAEVFVINESARGTEDFIVDSGISSSTHGKITFENLLNGVYNITANYTLEGMEYELYNSTKFGKTRYNLTGKAYTFDIALDLWTIDFEITDWDGLPLNYGYIEVLDEYGGSLLKTLTLNDYGKATFRWKTDSDFYYKVYYDNDDYVDNPFLLNESYILRSKYLSERFQTHDLYVNNVNLYPSTYEEYKVQERFYTDGSQTDFSNKKIIKANITLTNMNDQISNVSIYYIDKDNSTGIGDENLILFKDDYDFGTQNDFFSLDMIKIENSKLISEFFDVRGLLLVVNGYNNTACNGLMTVDLLESTNILNVTALTRLNIRVININELFPLGAPIDSLVKVYDESGESLVNLTSIASEDGYAYGENNDYEIPFWFFKDRTYNFSIDVLNVTNINFNVTFMSPENQWSPTSNAGVDAYNYTLFESGSITFNIIFAQTVNLTDYDTSFFNSSATYLATWGDPLSYSLDFYYTEDGGTHWYPITKVTSTCTIQITLPGESEILFETEMNSYGNGTYWIIIDSEILSAAYSYKYYSISITGNHPGYPPPNEKAFLLRLNAVQTSLSVHDYDSLAEVGDKTFTAYFDELVNISMHYVIDSSELPLEGATLTYEWMGLTPAVISSDPVNAGFYTFTINTFDAQTIGIKIISVTAQLQNYSEVRNYLIYVEILPRLTTINGNNQLEYVNDQIWVQNRHIYNFAYEDSLRSTLVGDLDVASYIWQEIDSLGNVIEGSDGSGTLYENTNLTYSLDFNTEFKSVGYYILYITFQKENYETRSALINLQIKLREFDYDLSGSNLQHSQLSVVQGEDLEIQIALVDLSRGSINLANASVYLEMQGNHYDFNETTPGVYQFKLRTSNIEAFFMSQIYSARITIQKDNFTTQQIPISITVKMEEIFPGMPTFYFYLIVGAIIGVGASAGIYRGVQQARIPKHVKKIRKIRKAIKSRKSISDSISIPDKSEMLVKLLGDDWKAIGLSLEDTLATERKLKDSPKNLNEGEII